MAKIKMLCLFRDCRIASLSLTISCCVSFSLALFSATLEAQEKIGQEGLNNPNVSLADASLDSSLETDGEAPSQLDQAPVYQIVGLGKDVPLNFRSIPSTKGSIIEQIYPRVGALAILEKQDEMEAESEISWSKVYVCGRGGWVADAYLQEQHNSLPHLQVCDGELVSPFPPAPEEVVEESIAFDTPVSFAFLKDEASFDGRTLGLAALSLDFRLCEFEAEGKAKAETDCLRRELLLWEKDLKVVFDLLSIFLPTETMKQLRDNQRLWSAKRQEDCQQITMSDDTPFTRGHPTTCALRLVIERTLDLENFLETDLNDFAANLNVLVEKDYAVETLIK